MISDPTRRQLLTELAGAERSVGDLVDAVGVSQPTVSKHLRVLREAGLVHIRAQGQRRFYSLDATPLAEVVLWVHGLVPGGVPAGADGPAAAARFGQHHPEQHAAARPGVRGSQLAGAAGAAGSAGPAGSAGLASSAAAAQSRPATAVSGAPASSPASGTVSPAPQRDLAAEALEAEEARLAARRQHGMGRSLEQAAERAQGLIDRFSKQRFGRRK